MSKGVLRTPGPRGSKFGKQCSRACCLPSLGPSQHGECEPPQARRPPPPHDEAAPVLGAPLPPRPQPTQSPTRATAGRRERPPPGRAAGSAATPTFQRLLQPLDVHGAAESLAAGASLGRRPGGRGARPRPPDARPRPRTHSATRRRPGRGGPEGSRGVGEARDGARRTEREPPRAATTSPPTWRPARQRAHAPHSCRPRARSARARAPPHTPRSAPGPPSARALRRRERPEARVRSPRLSSRAAEVSEQKECS